MPFLSLRGVPQAQRGNPIAWFPHAQLFPMFVIARKDGVLTKQSLFFRTPGISNQLRPNYQRLLRGTTVPLAMTEGVRLPRALCALAMTDGGGHLHLRARRLPRTLTRPRNDSTPSLPSIFQYFSHPYQILHL